jgi:type III pantothenate kinase
MSAFIVADVGNSRIKWGRCNEQQVLEAARLPLNDPAAWDRQVQAWNSWDSPFSPRWTLAGVNPDGLQGLAAWLAARVFQPVQVVTNKLLAVPAKVDCLDQVGVDRLLNAVAFNSRRATGEPGIIVDAGSAVTVDWVDEAGTFRGGAILPGFRLMARSLHEYTAKLPLIDWHEPSPSMPGTNTHAAMACGIHAAEIGGVLRLADELAAKCSREPARIVTGGDSTLLEHGLPSSWKPWMLMTLEGLRLTALRLM